MSPSPMTHFLLSNKLILMEQMQLKEVRTFTVIIFFRAEFIELGVTRFSCCKGQYWGCDALKVCKHRNLLLISLFMLVLFSPVEFYESLNCRGKYVEDMTSEECTQCQMEITQYNFITVPYLLSWAENKVNVMLCVKKSDDIPRAITTLIENNAAHRAFLELDSSKVLQLEIDQVPHWDEVYYVAHVHNKDQLSR
jgi:hypothetical protein